MLRTILCVLLLLTFARNCHAEPSTAVRVPPGFEATLFADDDLAHDIYSLTVDSLGRVTVAGAGYVRILVDADGDGRAESAHTFSEAPQSGAQGLFWLGRDLLCTGDGALLRFRDSNADDRADGPPDRFLELRTGGEHDTHSVQRGPDGWWYLIAGNSADISSRYVTLPGSPVRHPQHGTIFRLKPDLTGGEVVAHGFRNPYDFAFGALGDLFTFDSDGERDVSLPWYRPTRVFQAVPGAHAGWVTRSWKQPDSYADMPPVLAEFGRGSPTGVVSYRHTQFPAGYRDSLFVLDWTYGRVINLRLTRDADSFIAEPDIFMSAIGAHGFAPTDAEVGPDGSLYVSVGGRGTRGGVYRIHWTGTPAPAAGTPSNSRSPAAAAVWPGQPATPAERLNAVLSAPQPLSSWSRAIWEPLAAPLDSLSFMAAARDQTRLLSHRLRAIEILVERFHTPATTSTSTLLDDTAVAALLVDPAVEIRARTAWAVGRVSTPELAARRLLPALADDDPTVGRTACEALLNGPGELSGAPLVAAVAKRLGSGARYDRMAAARLVPQFSETAYADLRAAVRGNARATLTLGFGALGRSPGINVAAVQLGVQVLERGFPVDLKRDAIRLMQLALGDLTPLGRVAPVFEGYAPALDLTDHERELDPYRIRLAERFPTGVADLDEELARLLAMLQPFNPDLLTRILSRITDQSHPTTDLHYLISAARIPATREQSHRDAIARGLVRIEAKLIERGLPQDTNWNDRLGELYKSLAEQDVLLPDALVQQPDFGLPGHVLFMSQVPAPLVPLAVAAFVRQMDRLGERFPWSTDVIFVLAESTDPAHRQLIRDQLDNFSVRSAVLMVLSGTPDPADRPLFVDGLDSPQPEVLDACLTALEQLPAADGGAEQVALVRCLRRLGVEKNEVTPRERVVRLLQRNTGQRFGFLFTPEGGFPLDAEPQREAAQRTAIQSWTAWVSEHFPAESATLSGSGNLDLAEFQTLVSKIDWASGDATRGRRLFETRSCAQCHDGRSALGPNLSGVTGRFSREDLLTAIVDPGRDVSNRYQTTLIETTAGRIYTGLIIYESVDGLILRNATNQTFRIETRDIALRRRLPQSLMPVGLLKDATPQHISDLVAYLASLTPGSAPPSGPMESD